VLAAIGCDPELGPRNPDIPKGKVAMMTSDTAKVMPATARALAANYDLFACHVLNLYLVDQMKICSTKQLLQRCNAIVNTFRHGAARKLFLLCAPAWFTVVSLNVLADLDVLCIWATNLWHIN
jgi:hypothetical protein